MPPWCPLRGGGARSSTSTCSPHQLDPPPERLCDKPSASHAASGPLPPQPRLLVFSSFTLFIHTMHSHYSFTPSSLHSLSSPSSSPSGRGRNMSVAKANAAADATAPTRALRERCLPQTGRRGRVRCLVGQRPITLCAALPWRSGQSIPESLLLLSALWLGLCVGPGRWLPLGRSVRRLRRSGGSSGRLGRLRHWRARERRASTCARERPSLGRSLK